MRLPRPSFLIAAAVLIAVVLVAWWWIQRPDSVDTAALVPRGEQLDTSVFADQSFTRLRAPTAVVIPVERGRANPFARPGRSSPSVLPSTEAPTSTPQ